MSDSRPGFTRAAVVAGMYRSLPLQVGVVPFGLVVGIVAQGQGLSLTEAVVMSATVYAGSAQLLALGHWGVPAPVVAAATASFIVNLRLALMGPVTEMQAGRSDAGFLFGSGVLMWAVWVVFTAVGHVMGGVLQPPPGHPIFFAALAVFVSILVPMWHGRGDLLPWIASAAVALGVAWLLPGTSWHIVAGALAGAGIGVARDRLRAQAA
jgi:predicted branched-subunit amino acid permease